MAGIETNKQNAEVLPPPRKRLSMQFKFLFIFIRGRVVKIETPPSPADGNAKFIRLRSDVTAFLRLPPSSRLSRYHLFINETAGVVLSLRRCEHSVAPVSPGGGGAVRVNRCLRNQSNMQRPRSETRALFPCEMCLYVRVRE